MDGLFTAHAWPVAPGMLGWEQERICPINRSGWFKAMSQEKEPAVELSRGDRSIIEALSRPAAEAWPELEVWRTLDYERLSAVLEGLIAAARCAERDILPDYWTAQSPLVNERIQPAKGAGFSQRDPETGEEFVWVTSAPGVCLAIRRIAVEQEDGKDELEVEYYRHFQGSGEPLARNIKAVSISDGEDRNSRKKEIELVNTRLFEDSVSPLASVESHKLETEAWSDGWHVVCHYGASRYADGGSLFGRSLLLRRYRRGQAERPVEEISIKEARDSIRDVREGKLVLKVVRQEEASASPEVEEIVSRSLERTVRSEEAALELHEGSW